MHPKEAFRAYDLAPRPTADVSPLEENLRMNGIARVEMPVKPSDFAALSAAYEVCIQECPEALAATASRLDERYGSEIGQARKECGVVDGVQVSDPKNLFHFSEVMRSGDWYESLGDDVPAPLAEFLKMGIELHAILIGQVARKAVGELAGGSYSNLSRLYFPKGPGGKAETSSVLRVIRYDAFAPFDKEGKPLELGEVAKRHFDISGITVQAYADAGGFWANSGGNLAPHEEREYHPTADGEGRLFLGQAHRRVYGSEDPLKPLWHGVDRVIPEDRPEAFENGSLVVSPDGVTRVPKRTAVILFGNAPHVDPGLTERDTKPNIPKRV